MSTKILAGDGIGVGSCGGCAVGKLGGAAAVAAAAVAAFTSAVAAAAECVWAAAVVLPARAWAAAATSRAAWRRRQLRSGAREAAAISVRPGSALPPIQGARVAGGNWNGGGNWQTAVTSGTAAPFLTGVTELS